MSSDPDVTELREQISNLESRLEQHHRALNAAIEQRDTFIFGSIWGLLKGAVATVLLVGALLGSERLMDSWGWDGPIAWAISVLVGCVVAVVASGLIVIYYDRHQDRDHAKMSKLPEWSRRDHD